MKIFYNNTELDVAVNDNSYRYRAIKGEHSLTLYYSLPQHVELPVGAYCFFENEKYTLEKPSNFKMHNTRNFEYTVIFDASQAKAKKYKFRNPVDRRLKFHLTAKPHEHLQMFVDNMNARDSGWTIGRCIEATEKLVTYNHAWCIDALTQMADVFETEYEINGKEVSLWKIEYNKDNPLPLSYGRGNGFKSGVGRRNEGDTHPVEILYVQGGDRNINRSKYGSPELLLPKNQTLEYEGRTYISDSDGFSIRRADKPIQTAAEDSLDCSHIYPSRVGTVTSVEIEDAEKHFYDFIDNTIPEDLNFEECLIEGETMTVIFQSGMLAGKEFEVKYTHADRRFKIVPQEIDGRTMPDSAFKPTASEKYAVFGISLPDAYVCNNADKSGASWDMFRAAAKYLYENEGQKFTFSGELDGIWAKKDWVNIGGRIKLGAYILFSDNQFQPEGVRIRIIGIKDYINNPHSPVIELSNSVVGSSVSSELRKIDNNLILTDSRHRDAISFTKRRYRDAVETGEMLSKALLDNFTASITPITVKTMQVLLGDESLQYRFVNNKTNPITVPHIIKYNDATKVLHCPAGIIQHMTLGIKDISAKHDISLYKFWDVAEFNSPTMPDKEAYYLYIKASTTNQTASFVMSKTAIGMTAVAGFYHLLVGVLNSEYDGTRSFVELYGFTEILPGRITTQRVVSADGLNFMDFVNNAFRVGDAFSCIEWNKNGDRRLRIKGTIVQSPSGVESFIGVFRGEYNAGYTYHQGDEVTYAINGVTSTYRYINATPSAGRLPTDAAYWQVVAQGSKGSGGDFYEYRYAVNGSLTSPPILSVTSVSPAGWTTLMPIVGSFRYLWCTVAKKNAEGELLQNWSTPVRITGYDGKDGEPGAIPFYRDEYSSTETYYGTSKIVNVVEYKGLFYISRVDAGDGFSNKVPTDTNYWNLFGSQFESVATKLILAQNANIAGWIFTRHKSSSQKIYTQLTTSDGTSRAVLDGVNGKIELASDVSKYTPSGGSTTVKQTIVIDSQNGKIEAKTSDNDVSSISSQGVFANRAGVQAVPYSSGIELKAAVAGLGYGDLQKDAYLNKGAICGVYGASHNRNSNPAPSWGGFFNKLLANGLYFACKRVTSSTWLSDTDCYVAAYNNPSAINIYLPASPQIGQIVFVRRMNNADVTVQGNGVSIHTDGSTLSSRNVGQGRGDIGIFVYDGQYWNYNYCGR